MLDAFRLTLSIFTIVPVGRMDPTRASARAAILVSPVAGAIVGGASAGIFALVRLAPGRNNLLAASLAVATAAILTRALHLDGLADAADALGVVGDPGRARRVMRSPEIGAFGAVAIALVLLIDVTAVAAAGAAHQATLCLILGGVLGRLAVVIACRRGVRAAEGSRLGAWVAEQLSQRVAAACAVVVVSIAVATGAATNDWRAQAAVQVLVACLASLVTGEAVRVLVGRHVEGLTGDVLGACLELSSTAAYVAIAVSGGLAR